MIQQYKLVLLLGILLVGFSACDDITDLNVNPNEPTAVPAANLLTEAEYELCDLLWGRTYNAEWSMLMVQHWAQNEYTEEQRYDVDGNDYNAFWADFYADSPNELKIARDLIAEDANLNEATRANQLAIIDILMAHAFHNWTDAFGSIPYTEALDPINFPLPAYDNQQAIYMAILETLSNSSKALNSGGDSFDSGELIYSGDVTMWKKLANSLMLRVAMRMVDVDAATAGQYITEAASGDLISSNDENAMFTFSSDANIANPLFVDNTVNTRDDFNISAELVDALKAAGDPRLDAFASPTNSGEIIGLPYGLTDGEAFALKSTTSRPNGTVREATAPAVIMDYAEVSFLLAEANQRGIIASGSAADYYAQGVTASMNYWGITDETAIADYIAANPYDGNDWKASIGLQKWFAFYMNGPQAWAEWRRLDQPVLAVPAAATNDIIPLRLPYPVTEQSRNGTSLSAVTSTPDDLNAKMWWDVN
ncbi:MAG: SusD/RagB family nutrient-binding outer membrane lipoprotein [Chitinophagales bacterium]|nr:SusD/RagB family nutrient-binding outer membrane lipoprotein [Chitinophagales bacterium]